ncbi:Gfo/Idh/MocA family protein [Kitasatospora sp. NPDC051853]|uniref:Gfo/Idh/MocA family protein n=1 Tax=Kitasatospora sp. NPDC051853 TaxID=3364058 RepID=UPI0037BC1073
MKVGLLSFAHTHALSYATLLRDMGDIELLTTDPDADGQPARPGHPRGRELADQLGVAYADSYEDLFAWRPDAVIVAAENTRHRALVEMAALHGADVLCEKPLATTLADAQAMIEVCRGAGVRLAVAHPVRFSPSYAAARAAVREGRLGKVLAVRGANYGRLDDTPRPWFSDPALAGGGALMDHTVHIADLLDDLLDGARATDVYAQTNRLLDPNAATETAGVVTVSYDNGTHATIDCSWSQPRTHPRWGDVEIQIVGEKATVELTAFGQLVSGYDEKNQRPSVHPWGTDLDLSLLRTFLHGPAADGIDLPDGQAGMRTLKIVLAGYESARTSDLTRIL